MHGRPALAPKTENARIVKSKNNCRPWRLVAGASLALFVGGIAGLGAEPEAEKPALRRFMEQDRLFGDWGGHRTALRDQHGVDFEFLYAASVPTALSGGLQSGSEYQGGLLMMLNVDSEKLGLWSHGSFRASSLYMHSGPSFSDHHVGDLNRVSLLDFPDTFRLWELWYEHKFPDGKVSLKAGQLDIGMDFIVPEYYNTIGSVNFLNQTFFSPTMAFNVYDQPYFPVGNHALAATPSAAPGARLRADLTPQPYAQAGVYEGNPDRSFGGTRFHLDGAEGALSYFEVGFKHNQGKDAAGPPGTFKLGAWYHTDRFFDMYDGMFVAFDNLSVAMGGSPLGIITSPREHGGNYGFYFLADHVLWLEHLKDDPAQRGLVGFFRVATATKDRNLAQFGVDGGLVYKGLLPTRDWDTLGVAFSYLQISDDLRHAQDDLRATLESLSPGAGAVVPHADYEAVLEMNYKLQLAAWCAADGSAQRVGFHRANDVQILDRAGCEVEHSRTPTWGRS